MSKRVRSEVSELGEIGENSGKKTKKTLERDTRADSGAHSLDEGVEAGPSKEVKKPVGPAYSKYFQYDKQGQQTAKCLLCEQKNMEKILKMKDGNTSSLRKHLLAKHKTQYDELIGCRVPKNQSTLDSFARTKEVTTFIRN